VGESREGVRRMCGGRSGALGGYSEGCGRGRVPSSRGRRPLGLELAVKNMNFFDGFRSRFYTTNM